MCFTIMDHVTFCDVGFVFAWKYQKMDASQNVFKKEKYEMCPFKPFVDQKAKLCGCKYIYIIRVK